MAQNNLEILVVRYSCTCICSTTIRGIRSLVLKSEMGSAAAVAKEVSLLMNVQGLYNNNRITDIWIV